MRRAQGGDHDAFGDLCLSLWPGLVALARSILVWQGDAEDTVQDVLIRAWAKLPELREPAAFSPWLKKSLLRECLRRAKRRRPSEDLSEVTLSGPPNQSTCNVTQALASLSPRQRAVVYLGDIQGLDDREIADLLNLRPTTVRVHRLHARDRLRQLLGAP